MFRRFSLGFGSKSGKKSRARLLDSPLWTSNLSPTLHRPCTSEAGADGEEHKWSVPGNWRIGNDPAPVKPGSNDDVVFDGSAGGSSYSTVDEDFTVRSLRIDKSVGTGASGTMTLNNDLTLTGD